MDLKIKAVVVGLDTKFTYKKLCIATLYIQTGGAKFIATNDDAYDMIQGKIQPGAAAMVEGIKATLSREEGSDPEIIGKPNPFTIDLIMKEHKIPSKDKYEYVNN